MTADAAPPAAPGPGGSGPGQPGDADDLAVALALADTADALTLARYQASDLQVTTKPDDTPVTDADTAAEAALRAALASARPGDAVLGEERGLQPGPGAPTGRQWVLDPIDGTKNFLRGVPVWATLIALQAAPPADRAPGGAGPELVVAVASAPALHRRWWARRGAGAFVTDTATGRTRRLAVSAVRDVADASLAYASLHSWAAAGRLPGFLALTGRCWRTRGYGDFWSHLLVAEGAVDLACEPEVSLWDLAAVALIVTEAGGRFTDLAGRPGPAGGSAVSSNGHLHDAALGLLAPTPAAG